MLCNRRHVLTNRNISSSLNGLTFAPICIQNPHYNTVKKIVVTVNQTACSLRAVRYVLFVTCCSPVLTGGAKSFPKNSASFLCYTPLLFARSEQSWSIKFHVALRNEHYNVDFIHKVVTEVPLRNSCSYVL